MAGIVSILNAAASEPMQRLFLSGTVLALMLLLSTCVSPPHLSQDRYSDAFQGSHTEAWNAWVIDGRLHKRGSNARSVTKLRIDDTDASTALGLIEPASIRHLSLQRAEITEADIQSIAGLASLEHLHLEGLCPITERSVKPLEKCSKLCTLTLHNGTAILASGMAALAHLVSLRTLELDGTSVADAEWSYIDNFKHLTSLRLRSVVAADPASYSSIAGCTGLLELALEGASIDDKTFVKLVECKKLEVLDISLTGLTESAVAAVSDLNIRVLKMNSCLFMKGGAALTLPRSLERLEMRASQRDPQLKDLAQRCISLAHLDLSGVEGRYLKDVKWAAFKELQSLHLAHIRGIDESSLTVIYEEVLAKATVREVRLSGSACWPTIGVLQLETTTVRSVILSDVPEPNHEQYEEFLGKGFRYIDLSDNAWLSDEHVTALAKQKELECLNISGSRSLSISGVEKYLAAASETVDRLIMVDVLDYQDCLALWSKCEEIAPNTSVQVTAWDV